jgi:hypothetical protein
MERPVHAQGAGRRQSGGYEAQNSLWKYGVVELTGEEYPAFPVIYEG